MKKIILILLLLLTGCNEHAVVDAPGKVTIDEPNLKVSSPVISHKAGQKDFSLPFYPSSIQISAYRCVSTIPDGRTGYISRADFESKNTVDEIVEFYKRRPLFIKDISVEGSRKIIVSDNPSMTVYPGKGLKSASTIVFYRNNEKACTELVFTGFEVAK